LLKPPQAASAPAQQAPSPPSSPSPPPVQAVPLAQIADQAEELDGLLREMSQNLEAVSARMASRVESEAEAGDVVRRARQTEDLLNGIPNIMELQGEDRFWRTLAQEYGNQRKWLTGRVNIVEEKIRWLDSEEARWKATSDQVRDKPGLEVVAQRVQQELDSIRKLRSEAQKQLNLALTVQNTISEQDREISVVLRKLDEAHERLRGKLFERDSYPLWAARKLRAPNQPTVATVLMSAGRGFTGAWAFLGASKALLIEMAAIYVVALFMAFHFRNFVVAATKADPMMDGSRVFARPFSVALLITLLTTIGITASAPTGVSFVVCLFYLLAVLRLLPLLIGEAMRKVLYVLCAFYMVEWLVLMFQAVFKRDFFVVMVLLAFVIFAWLTRPSRLKMQSQPAWRGRLQSTTIHIGLFLLVAAAAFNILGFVSLSQVLAVGTLFSAFTFALLYTMVRVLHLSMVMVVNSKWFQSLPDGHGEVIERWGRRLLVICAALLWLNVNLYLFTVRNDMVEALKGVLQYPIGYGKVHVTLGGMLGMVLLVLLGYAIANMASFILGKILLPRISLRGGMAYAISRVTYYVLLAGLFFIALTNAGLQLDKFTVITGALGLGVGFGLQNIVNNFASGLIVLFERPIRLNDTVEIGGVAGTVRRIGARSSTVLTAQGAEVIFPNSTLLSNQVTNWTLSSTRRRVEITVGVSYGANPEVVLELLTEIANRNDRVLTYPPPQTMFLGFGENALNFELTFWAPQSIWFELKSEIGLTVFRSLRKAGIEIPFPQRDLHLRNLDSRINEEPLAESTEPTPRKKMVAG